MPYDYGYQDNSDSPIHQMFRRNFSNEITEQKATRFLLDLYEDRERHPSQKVRIAAWLAKIAMQHYMNAIWFLELEIKKHGIKIDE